MANYEAVIAEQPSGRCVPVGVSSAAHWFHLGITDKEFRFSPVANSRVWTVSLSAPFKECDFDNERTGEGLYLVPL